MKINKNSVLTIQPDIRQKNWPDIRPIQYPVQPYPWFWFRYEHRSGLEPVPQQQHHNKILIDYGSDDHPRDPVQENRSMDPLYYGFLHF